MSVTETKEALGSFDIELLGNVPREVLDSVDFFGHIAVVPGRMDPRQYGDGTLDAARYVGVVQGKEFADDGRTNLIEDNIRITGVGMNYWLGDADGKGAVIETAKDFTGASFSTVMGASGLRPASVGAGTLGTVSGSYSGHHQYETARDAIAFVCETMSTPDIPLSFRVNNRGNLDAGPESGLYVTNPTCIVVRKGSSSGEDLFIRSIPGNFNLSQDVQDFATRVVMLAEIDDDSIATGTADLSDIEPDLNVYKDIHGNPLNITLMVSESDTVVEMADARAEINLRKVIESHRTLTLATDEYDIYGSFKVGDYIYIYDPDAGLVDLNNEVIIRGIRVNPMRLQVTETDWPVTNDYTVAYRNVDGAWFDLTDYIHFEEASTSKITIGDFDRALVDTSENVAARVAAFIPPDSSTPAAPVMSAGSTSVYLDGIGSPKASQTLSWTVPLNTDGTAVSDGDRYEVSIRKNGDTDWAPYFQGWGVNTIRLSDLSVAVSYQARVRAVDTGNNASAYSNTVTFTTSADSIAPSTPAAPTVAANTMAIQVTHNLGISTGGTFNLQDDIAYLEVHYSATNGFSPSSSTLAGRLTANKSMLISNTPAVGSFQIEATTLVYVKVIAVDMSGNKSGASAQATSTADLVDSAHISDLTASKITAGTLSADMLLGASIRTNATGARLELNQDGIQAYNSSGTQTVTIDAANGDVSLIGSLTTGLVDSRVEIIPTNGSTPAVIQLWNDDGDNVGRLSALTTGGEPSLTLATTSLSASNKVGQVGIYSDAFIASVRSHEPGGTVDSEFVMDNTGGFTFYGSGFSAAASKLAAGSLSLASNLTVTGSGGFGTDVRVGDDLTVVGDATVGGDVVVTGSVTSHVTTTTSGLSASSNWSVVDFEARETCGVVQFRCLLVKLSGSTNYTITPAGTGNINDVNVCTLPSGWRPSQEMRVEYDYNGSVSGSATVQTGGLIIIKTATSDITDVKQLTVTGTFVQ